MQSDLSYFSGRADEELRAATEACDSKSRRVHLDLASRYADLAQAIRAHHRALYVERPEQRQTAEQHAKRVGIWL